jgi:hypothetical protein
MASTSSSSPVDVMRSAAQHTTRPFRSPPKNPAKNVYRISDNDSKKVALDGYHEFKTTLYKEGFVHDATFEFGSNTIKFFDLNVTPKTPPAGGPPLADDPPPATTGAPTTGGRRGGNLPRTNEPPPELDLDIVKRFVNFCGFPDDITGPCGNTRHGLTPTTTSIAGADPRYTFEGVSKNSEWRSKWAFKQSAITSGEYNFVYTLTNLKSGSNGHILRVSRQNRPLSLNQAMDDCSQFIYASQQECGPTVHSVAIVKMNSDPPITDDCNDVVGDQMFGLVMIVEKMNDFDSTFNKNNWINENVFRDQRVPVDDIHETNLVAMVDMVMRISSCGIVFGDWQLNNLMFNKGKAKLIDFDSKFGTVLTFEELVGTNEQSKRDGWKPLLVLNMLMFLYSFCVDSARFPILRFLSAIKVEKQAGGGSSSSSSSSFTLYQNETFQHSFKRIVQDVRNVLEAMENNTLPDNASVAQKILFDLKWKGGFNGSGIDVYDFEKIEEEKKYKLEKIMAQGMLSPNCMAQLFDGAGGIRDNNLERVKYFIRTIVYSYGFKIHASQLEKNLRQLWVVFSSQDEITDKLINDFVTSGTPNTEATKTVQLAFDHLQKMFYTPPAKTNILRQIGKVRKQGLPLIDLLQSIVFGNTRDVPFANYQRAMVKGFKGIGSHNDPTLDS